MSKLLVRNHFKFYILPLFYILFSLISTNAAYANAHKKESSKTKSINVKWSQKNKTFSIDSFKLKIGLNAACGVYDNQAEYASFGLELQIFKCSKVVIPINIKYKKFFGVLDFAPLYDSIKSVNKNQIIYYGKDSQGRDIQGNNPYFDWYKNLGTRIYYTGKYDFLDAYFGYKIDKIQKVIAGRMKNETGLKDSDMPWGDNGMFSPYSYWLSRDLYTGISYRLNSKYLNLSAAILSGNNPMKGYADYLNHIQSANLKANNSPTLALNLDIPLGYLFLKNNNKLDIVLGLMKNKLSSTWADSLKDGKRRNNVYAIGENFYFNINKNWGFQLFSQYTIYESGLNTDSNQYNPANKLFKNITQNGFFTGIDLHYKNISIGYTYERFKRFDYNVYYNWVNHKSEFKGKTLTQLENMHQSSNIINLKYKINNFTTIALNYQSIYNPVEWVSSVLDNESSYRASAEIDVDF